MERNHKDQHPEWQFVIVWESMIDHHISWGGDHNVHGYTHMYLGPPANTVRLIFHVGLLATSTWQNSIYIVLLPSMKSWWPRVATYTFHLSFPWFSVARQQMHNSQEWFRLLESSIQHELPPPRAQTWGVTMGQLEEKESGAINWLLWWDKCDRLKRFEKNEDIWWVYDHEPVSSFYTILAMDQGINLINKNQT